MPVSVPYGSDDGYRSPSGVSRREHALSPTPSGSAHVSLVSVSGTFHPAAQLDGAPADVLLISADSVWFYVHTHRLAGVSTNGFDTLAGPTPPPAPLGMPESASVLTLVLHAVYDLPLAHFTPSLDDLAGAVDALARYGAVHLAERAPLHDAVLGHASTHPLAVYCLAGAHALDALAVASSVHLHSFALATLTDADAVRMGTHYLRRLFFLHLGRGSALKRILIAGPAGHPPTPTCGTAAQAEVTRAWALAAAYLSWEARADVPASQLSRAFSSLEAGTPCALCRTALAKRVEELLVQWSLVKATI